MLTESSTITTTAIYSDDQKHRYLLSKVWDEVKPKITIIMTNPSTAGITHMDYTTMYIQNNLAKLGYGGADIVNLFSVITTKLNTKSDITGNSGADNLNHILKSAESTDKVIIAWGKLGEGNKQISAIQNELLKHLKPFSDKLYLIESEQGQAGLHPLAPQIRFSWILQKFEFNETDKPMEVEPPTAENQPKKSHKQTTAH